MAKFVQVRLLLALPHRHATLEPRHRQPLAVRRARSEVLIALRDPHLARAAPRVEAEEAGIQQDGFDLDLTYITEQIIAMGLPCTGVSGIYRNPQGEVIKFLTAYHEGQYKIYNLCARPQQDQYDAEKFAGRAACYPFEDHEVPPLKMVDTLARATSRSGSRAAPTASCASTAWRARGGRG